MAIKKNPRKIYCIDEKGNKILDLKQWKIKNFSKVYYDSYFEYEAAQLLNKAGFHVDFHPESRELIPAFKTLALSRAKGKAKLFMSSVRSMSYTCDFAIYTNSGHVIWLEMKGFLRDAAKLYHKAFKATLQPHEIFVIVYDLETLKDLIDIINNDYKGSSKNPQPEVVKQKTINI